MKDKDSAPESYLYKGQMRLACKVTKVTSVCPNATYRSAYLAQGGGLLSRRVVNWFSRAPFMSQYSAASD